MSNVKFTTLPSACVMQQRLESVSVDPFLVEGFYPPIVRHAGEKKNCVGVIMMLQLAIADCIVAYIAHDPTRYFDSVMYQEMSAAIQVMLPDYIAALIDDEDVRRESLEFFNDALQRNLGDKG